MLNKPVLTNEDALKLMAACKAEARKIKCNMSIAIVDTAGMLLMFERLDGALPVSVGVAQEKAKASALLRAPTEVMAGLTKDFPAMNNLPGLLMPGGVPLMHQGECVGAIGASGGQGHEDVAVATAGAKALG